MKPLHDWILVKTDPLPTQIGSIIMPNGGNIRTATVVHTGPGRRSKAGTLTPISLVPGDRVAYFLLHEQHKQGKALGAVLEELGEDLALIREPDVLFAFEGEGTIT